MEPIRPGRAALALAILLGGWHLIWSALVAMSWAQPVIDFVFRIHFIRPVYVIQKFDTGTALLLIAVTAAVGYAGGWIIAVLWNKLHKA